MKKKIEIKYHREPLEIIENFKNHKSGVLISKNSIFNQRKAEFHSHLKEFTIDFKYDVFSINGNYLNVGASHEGVQIQFGNAIYNLEHLFLGNYSTPNVTGRIDRVHTNGFSEKTKYYYQLIIPLEEEIKFHFTIEQLHFISDMGYHSRSGTMAEINGEPIHVYVIHNEQNQYFLAIDSKQKQTFDEFAEKAHAVKIGLAYLSGSLAGNQGFFFAYTQKNRVHPKHFRCVGLRDSIQSGYQPIYSNAYGYLNGNNKLAEKYHPLLRTISITEFSLLCEKIHNSLDFSSTLMLILESSIASLLFMPGGYAIALETISDLVIGNKKMKLAPIKNKGVSRIIRKGFLAVLDQNSESISTSDLEIIKKRIDQFNQTTNKARLRAPFELLNIPLLDEDLKILQTRNDFLHGRVPDLTSQGSNRSINRINKDLYYCSMRFYTLLNMIILKWVGYDNRVVNYPKIHMVFTEISVEEEPFRQV